MTPLPPAQRSSLSRDHNKNPDIDLVDLIDANHLVRVVTKNYDRAFEDVFHNFRQTQSWLMQVAESRKLVGPLSYRRHARR